MLADICVVAIVAIFIWLGYKSGLMKTFIEIASYIVSIIISFFLYPVISDLLVKTPIYSKLVEVIGKEIALNSVSDSMGQGAFGILSNYINKGVQSAAMGVAESMAVLIINILAFVIVLLLSKVIIRIVGNVLGIFTKLPIIKQFNRLGGSILGGVMGVLALYIISTVLVLVSPIEPQSRLYNEIEHSTFASEIYENNIILDYLGKEK